MAGNNLVAGTASSSHKGDARGRRVGSTKSIRPISRPERISFSKSSRRGGGQDSMVDLEK